MASELEKKYESGNYICCYNAYSEQEDCTRWVIVQNPVFDDTDENYALIHVKHEELLKEYLEDDDTPIEIYISHNEYPYHWEDYDWEDFIKCYDEDNQYRLKTNAV